MEKKIHLPENPPPKNLFKNGNVFVKGTVLVISSDPS